MTREEALELIYNNRYTQVTTDRLLDNGYYVIKTIICIEIYFKIIIVNFASFVRISTHKF